MAVPVYIPPDASKHPALLELAAALSLPTLHPDANGLILEYQHDHLQIRPAAGHERPWFVDFSSARSDYRRAFGGGIKQTLARAIGVKANKRPHVVDATAGWGRDAFVLASLGCEIDMIERHAVVSALLADGLRRAAASSELADILQRIRLHRCDAHDYLSGLTSDALPDTIYLDPMYPHTSKTAAAKKNLRLLRELLDDPEHEPRLLDAALSRAGERVVVKRPKSAPPLSGRAPDTRIASPNTRYDVYFTGLD